MEYQKTIKREVELQGTGLHTGEEVRIRFKPAPPDSGINFQRIDLPGKPFISVSLNNIIDINKSPRRTSVGNREGEVHTIEHLMAVLSVLNIDNLFIEIDGSEVPGMDGSAFPFLQVLEEAGIEEQNIQRKSFQIREPIWLNEGEASIVILPSQAFKISYLLSYDHHPYLKPQYLNFVVERDIFVKEIAPARTFCLEEEVEILRNQGMGLGANYDNTIVVGERGVLKNRLRFEDEFARHKVLDLIGDLYLLGYALKGYVIAIKSGHPLNIRLLQKIEQQRARFMEGAIKSVSTNFEWDKKNYLDINDIQKILPHRYPFLFVDKIVELEEDKRAVGIKNVSIDDYFFQGHFPGRPVMPGVLIVEAMAQVAGVLMLSKKENQGKLAYFMSIDNVKFRRTVLPGDQLRLEVEVVRLKSKTGQVHTKAYVDSKVVAEADLMFALVEA
ncbi:MAG: bifunctional UDP-3-O-[3-hydroxymyristoyl] N-acetylglucosamine deacetylase/3-hydroxyacyl-ACP dehydratase [Candidatus Omnitrophica bacterium]|nr:bifunctional UDP-3-O-[3-hydroxymyristoyl] N-acetylglucosamine deacetylase/3-hydroxyacyl-ACP dehydratase [Candidatus Omnitrophota bacterium]